MRYLTLKQVLEEHNGVLPADAVLRADDGEEPAVAKPPKSAAAPLRRPPGKGHGPNPIVRKVLAYRRFFEALPTLEPMLSPGSVSLWCWLWTCADRRGRARTSERRLAERFGMARDTVRGRLAELKAAGLLRCVRRGKHGRSATVYHVRPTPNRVQNEPRCTGVPD